MSQAFQRQDASLNISKTLPASATVAYSTPIDLRHGLRGQPLHEVELEVGAPALSVSQLANASTMTYKLQHAVDLAFTSPIDLDLQVIIQTGAGGVGAAAATKRVRLPSDTLRYVRLAATNSAAADASGASMTLTPKF